MRRPCSCCVSSHHVSIGWVFAEGIIPPIKLSLSSESILLRASPSMTQQARSTVTTSSRSTLGEIFAPARIDKASRWQRAINDLQMSPFIGARVLSHYDTPLDRLTTGAELAYESINHVGPIVDRE